jgi:hypothetical protein
LALVLADGKFDLSNKGISTDDRAGAGEGVFFYLRGKTSDKAAENDIMNNPIIFIAGIGMMKSMKVRYLEHVESMGVKRRSCVIVAGQLECDVSLRKLL